MKTYTSKSGKAFGNSKAGYKAQVGQDGTVRVWDSVAGHWTLCHSLTAGQIRRIVRLAK